MLRTAEQGGHSALFVDPLTTLHCLDLFRVFDQAALFR